MKTVKEYPELMPAEIDRSLLEAEGIMCDILNQNLLYISYAPCADFAIKLVVADEDYNRALSILNATIVEDSPQE
ncbi:MAG: DUF2007 domain-containing protein [Bacteroidales bacterium]|nr:DUF2007 domain-containing protein [Bacteroidales bacterium]MBQ6081260.1 DUF2007 domain-containing protein [Bacteroidales bacterium]MBQ7457653.1 DUF2007 domain-containing protein [Bacteroidales bacterium]MBQ9530245.1 DUF2007 domain-containing protein [Bacteroidales bacterium]